MRYVRRDAQLEDVLIHLRNKNISLVTSSSDILSAAARRLGGFLEKELRRLSLRNGTQVVVSEQIVEHALVFRHLHPSDRTILDFGGFESLLPLQLAALGIHVVVLDRRPYPFQHSNLRVICDDLFHVNPEVAGRFDVVVSISTIEHLGLGRYGDMIAQEDADVKGVRILWSVVKPGGRLMASVPAGKAVVQRGYRVYDESRLARVFPFATSIRWYAKESREAIWSEVAARDVRDKTYQAPFGQMPIEALAFVICNK